MNQSDLYWHCRLIFALLGFFMAWFLPVSVGAQEAQQEAETEEKDGTWLERADGRKLLFYVEENNFFLEFYDEEKNPEEPDARRAAVHFTPALVRNRQTVSLAPDREGKLLTSPRHIRPPHTFQVILVLIKDEDGHDTETFSFRIVQEEE